MIQANDERCGMINEQRNPKRTQEMCWRLPQIKALSTDKLGSSEDDRWCQEVVMLSWIRDSTSSWLTISARSSSGRSGNLATSDGGIESKEGGSCLDERHVEPDPQV